MTWACSNRYATDRSRGDAGSTKMIAVHDLGGEGEPLLVCHATGFCGLMYEPFARTLATQHHVFAVDLRGHGDSPLWTGASLEWSDITADVLDAARGIRGRLHLFG